MFEPRFDWSAFDRRREALGAAADQMPFVLAGLLNDGAFKARQVWINQTWPSHVQQRNASFMNAALRAERADKRHLRVALQDRLGRDYLQRLAKGGIKRPVRSKKLGVPLKGWARLGPRGIAPSQKIQAIIANTPKRALRITPQGLFVGENGRLQLRYSFKQQVVQPKRVPFYEDWAYVMGESLRTGFADKMRAAMRTRKR